MKYFKEDFVQREVQKIVEGAPNAILQIAYVVAEELKDKHFEAIKNTSQCVTYSEPQKPEEDFCYSLARVFRETQHLDKALYEVLAFKAYAAFALGVGSEFSPPSDKEKIYFRMCVILLFYFYVAQELPKEIISSGEGLTILLNLVNWERLSNEE